VDQSPAVTLVHSSDLHLGSDSYPSRPEHDNLDALRQVLGAAERVNADAVLLAGDVFDHNRQGEAIIARAREVLLGAERPVVILPGNHDPLTEDSVYRRGLTELPHVHILGLTAHEAIHLPHLDLEVHGRAHRDYADMPPLPGPRERSTRWLVVMAHGHWTGEDEVSGPYRASWLFSTDDLEATGADYVALGHWNRAVQVGEGTVPSYYSGSPDLAATVNVVRLTPDGVQVERLPLMLDAE
jgi:DNA repair exonuclease SbcCD nuclease subunit